MAHLAYLHTEACGAGDLAYELGWIGKVHGGGVAQAQLTFPLEIRFRRGLVAPGVSQTCQRDGSAEAQRWVFARCKQVPWQELVPFGSLAGGRGREMALASTFVPRQAELCIRGSTPLPPRCKGQFF